MAKINLDAFHGTDSKFSSKIQTNNFTESTGDHHWLGDGVYFFVQGNIPPSPDVSAEKWAIAQAWNSDIKSYEYRKFSVIYANIEVDEKYLLDLTTFEGMTVYNYLRDKFVAYLAKLKLRLKHDDEFKDGHIINDARTNQNLRIDVVKGDFYVKFASERKQNVRFRIPNITMAAAFNVSDCIDIKKIKVHKTGEIR